MSFDRPTGLSRKALLEAAASFGIFGALGSLPAQAGPSQGVVGAWSLVSFDVDEPGAARRPRFGANPVGYLMYTADGHMSAVLAGSSRPKFESPSASTSTQEQRTQALLNFLAYAGRYEVRGDHVLHHVDVSVFTNLMGTTLERQFKIEGDTLTIRTLPPEIWNGSNVLVWKRAKPWPEAAP